MGSWIFDVFLAYPKLCLGLPGCQLSNQGVLLGVVSLLLVIFLYIYPKLLRPTKGAIKKKLPMPPGYPIVGNAPQLGLTTLHLDLTSLAARLGDVFQVKLFVRNMVVANTADSIREALVGHSSDWAGRLVSYRGHLSTGHQSLFMTSDVEYLRTMKQKATKALTVYGSADATLESLSMDVVEDFLEDVSGKAGRSFDMRGDLDRVVR